MNEGPGDGRYMEMALLACWKYGLLTDTLPETNIFAFETGWLEYDPFLLGFRPIFRGYVSFREGISFPRKNSDVQ